MTRLGHVRTQLGVITLHHRPRRQQFETRNTWTDTGGKTRCTRVLQSPERAWDWYCLCQRDGITVKDFPLDGEA